MIVDPNSVSWHKSSYSGGGDTQCVEVAPLWRKSSYSGGSNTQCVEVAPMPQTVGVRDTKNRERGHLTVSRTAWTVFVRGVAR